jgi:1,4-dihydroxy-2-naphthoate octaprenyltransferase
VAGLSALLTLATLFWAFGLENWHYLLLFCGLGGLAIWASIKYTVGDNAYGYRGLGDVFVFLFFGLLSVLGTVFVYTKSLHLTALLPALAIGALSTAVLNLNNLRDWESDKASGKRTLVVLMGYRNGRRYQIILCALAFVSMGIYVFLSPNVGIMALSLLPFLLVGKHVFGLKHRPNPADLDPELKKIALSTFFIGLILFILKVYIL